MRKCLILLFTLICAGAAHAQSVTQCLLPPGGGNPWANCSLAPVPLPVQTHAAVSSGSVTTLANAFTSNNTAGNSIVVSLAVGNNASVTISDTNSNVYNLVQKTCNSTTFCAEIFNATNIKAGANTVTATITSSSVATEIYEFSGLITATNVAGGSALAAANAVDQVSGSTNTSGSLTTGPISTIAPNEYAVAAFAVGTAAQTVTVASPFNNDSGQQNPTTPSGLFSFVSASAYLSTVNTLAATATMTSEPWATSIASFKSVLLPTQTPAPAQPAVVVASVGGVPQVNNKVSAGAATTLTNPFPGNTTAGNTILCVGFEGAVTGAVAPAFTDAQGNTFVSVTSGAAAAPGFAVSVATNIIGGTTDTITETVVSGSASFTCYELKGAATVGQVWDYAANLQATSATLVFGQQSAGIPNDFAAVAVGMGAGTVNATPSIAGVPAALTVVDQQNTAPLGTAALAVYYSAHVNVTNVPTFTQSISISASETYSALLVSMKPFSVSLAGNIQDPCQQGTGISGNINLAASAQVITGVSGKQTYICSLNIITATAQNIALVEGTGSTCGTGTTGMAGGTTAATGWNFAANGGLVNGSGGYWAYKTVNTGDNVCLLLSSTGQTSGSFRFVQQ